MRRFVISIFLLLLIVIGYLIITKPHVSVVDAHYDGRTGQVIVDKLPFLESDKISWWNESKENIMRKYNIPSGQNTPFLITIYAFGDGYKEEEEEDRRCFQNIKPPKNCIDKNIIMSITRRRDGSVNYDF
ncbi:DUF943 family protein [Rosenbergiella gaditana]|uniref:DUF943 family protein n=1 Tax=Rosenbergiella gaditana TaxID=2726987 RepID=UPI0020244317|nr:DUF943 family protein [Rosenbergiella gaditana]